MNDKIRPGVGLMGTPALKPRTPSSRLAKFIAANRPQQTGNTGIIPPHMRNPPIAQSPAATVPVPNQPRTGYQQPANPVPANPQASPVGAPPARVGSGSPPGLPPRNGGVIPQGGRQPSGMVTAQVPTSLNPTLPGPGPVLVPDAANRAGGNRY